MSARTFGETAKTSPTGPCRYLLDVTASDVVDLVRSAGGWLFDRSMAGWDVHVAIPRDVDLRPLHILGVGTAPRELDDDGEAPGQPAALAASADAVGADSTLRADVLHAMKRGIGDVLIWGHGRPDGIERGLDTVEHELSSAARVFKGHALAALGLSEAVGPTETFRGRTSLRAAYSDLAPAVATSLAQR